MSEDPIEFMEFFKSSDDPLVVKLRSYIEDDMNASIGDVKTFDIASEVVEVEKSLYEKQSKWKEFRVLDTIQITINMKDGIILFFTYNKKTEELTSI